MMPTSAVACAAVRVRVVPHHDHRDDGEEGSHDEVHDDVEARDAGDAGEVGLDHVEDAVGLVASADLLVDGGAQRADQQDNVNEDSRNEDGEVEQAEEADGGENARDDEVDDVPAELGDKAAPAARDALADVDALLLGGGVDAPGREARPLEHVAEDAQWANDGHEARQREQNDGLEPALVAREQRP